jgi:hypothetical protein
MVHVNHLFYVIIADFQARRPDRPCFIRFLKRRYYFNGSDARQLLNQSKFKTESKVSIRSWKCSRNKRIIHRTISKDLEIKFVA